MVGKLYHWYLVIILLVVSSSGWENINLIAGEPVDIWLHTWFSDILLTSLDESLWWESFITGSVIIVLLIISSSGWKDIDLVAGKPVNVWLHSWFGNVSLTSLHERWWESTWAGTVVSILFVISSGSWENVNIIGGESVNFFVHLWLSNILSGLLSVPLGLAGSVVLGVLVNPWVHILWGDWISDGVRSLVSLRWLITSDEGSSISDSLGGLHTLLVSVGTLR